MRFKKKALRQRQSISHNVIPAVLFQKLNLLEKNKYLSDVLETNYLTVTNTPTGIFENGEYPVVNKLCFAEFQRPQFLKCDKLINDNQPVELTGREIGNNH